VFKSNSIFKDTLYILIVAVILIVIFEEQIKLINYLVWEDEFETIVTSKMMDSGLILYKEIFNQHGPLTFFISLIIEEIGFNKFLDYRMIIILLKLFIIASFIFEPILKSKVSKISAMIFFTIYSQIVLPDIYGHTYTYQNLTGLLLLIIFIQYVIPSVFFNKIFTKNKIIIYTFLISCLPFLAITYLPITITILILIYKKNTIKIQLAGILLGLVFNMVYLFFTSSIKGYYVYHYYLNATILSKYYPNQSIDEIVFNIFRSIQPHIVSVIIVLIISGIILIGNNKNQWYKILLLYTGALSLLIRGVDFQALPFYYLFGVSIILFLYFMERMKINNLFVLSLTILSVYTYFNFFDLNKIKNNQVPTFSDFQQLAKFTTDKKDKIFSYTFKNSEYVLSDRLPAVPDFFYLPMQSEYYENPILGISNNVCVQLKKELPKIGYFEKYDFTTISPWDNYAGCLNQLMSEYYKKFAFETLLIRKDLLITDNLVLESDSKPVFAPSNKIMRNNNYKLLLNKNVSNYQFNVEKIGILFATYGNDLEYPLTLEITSTDYAKETYSIQANKIKDNRYTFLDLNNIKLNEIKITSNSNQNVSVWESRGKDRILSCVALKFTNGKFYFTPGCLPF